MTDGSAAFKRALAAHAPAFRKTLLVEPKLAERYGQHLQDTYEAAFVLGQSETWTEFDEHEALALIDRAVMVVATQKDERDPGILVPDPEYRIRNVVYGVAAGLSYFADLTSYIEGQPSYTRLEHIGSFMLSAMLASSAIKGRHAGKMESALGIAWRFGVAIALLDFLHEIPDRMPARLP